MAGSQGLPGLLGDGFALAAHAIRMLTVVALSFIMIHVGYEFDIDKTKLASYGWDYIVAMTAAAFPWVFVCVYFVFVMFPSEVWGSWPAWKEALLAGRFAAPTSAGVLFSMLAAAGLGGTWLFRKARILAIFDDLDTVLLMIPLKMLMIGWAWQLGGVVVLMAALLWAAWRCLHRWRIPISWPWVLGYAVGISLLSEAIYFTSQLIDETVPVHIEVLLPAFVLGCVIARPKVPLTHSDGARGDHGHALESPQEKRVAGLVSAVFMVLVGLSMPGLFGDASAAGAEAPARTISASTAMPGWGLLSVHVVALTILSNLGKMFPAFCYRKEASRKARWALAIGMWPRGEVGAGILITSLGYGLGGPIVTSAMLCLALNLVLTGVFVVVVRKLAL